MEFNTGYFEGVQAIARFGLAEAEGMVDYFMALDNKGGYGLGFAQAVADKRIDSLA